MFTLAYRQSTGSRASRRVTEVACHRPLPLIVGIARALSSAAMALRVWNPAACSSAMIGAMSAARRATFATPAFTAPDACNGAMVISGLIHA
jgi:hypothetical protein